MKQPRLLITPSVPVWQSDGQWVFDRKFYDGLMLYVQKWPGPVSCVMALAAMPPPDFGLVTVNPDELPFSCIALAPKQVVSASHLQDVAIVLASGDADEQLHISRLCRAKNIACVYIIEYIPETRYQIVSLTTRNPVIKLRRLFYVWEKERKRLAAFKCCDGLQSNGTPAHDEYHFVANNLLYFDTRVYQEQIITDADLQQRLHYLSENNPLRLAFSGRLIRMKGADHLVLLAAKLKQSGIPFQLAIYGAGELDAQMRADITRHQLDGLVSMPGAVDFYDRLLPDLKQSVDMFICLHRQSDPSCTYLETLSCGLPIAGYNNRAFSGLTALADIGWGVAMDDLDGIAAIVGHLHQHRDELAAKSKNSAEFARQHDFGSTFQRRIDHLRATLAKTD